MPARCLSVTCPAARTLIAKPYQQSHLHSPALPPTAAGQLSMLLPSEYLHQPASAVAAKLAHTCSNHYKSSLTTCAFHPQNSRIVTGNKNGDMALWDLTNGFKYIKQWTAHHMTRLSALEWSHNEQYCITGDANGTVKYVSVQTADSRNDGVLACCQPILISAYTLHRLVNRMFLTVKLAVTAALRRMHDVLARVQVLAVHLSASPAGPGRENYSPRWRHS